MKIRSHLLLLVLGAMLPVLAFSAVMGIVFWRQQREAFEARFLERVRAMAVALDRELEGHVRALQVLGHSPRLAGGDLRGFYAEAGRVREAQQTWSTVLLTDPAGGEVFDVRRPFGAALPHGALGVTAARVAVAGRTAVSALVRDPVSGDHVTAVMVPVKRGADVSHVLVAVIEVPAWLRFLSSYPVAADATMTLLDQDGIVIARTLNHERWIGQRPAPALYESSRNRSEHAYRSVGLEGQWFYSAHSRSAVSGWTVATGVPVVGVERELRGSTWPSPAAPSRRPRSPSRWPWCSAVGWRGRWRRWPGLPRSWPRVSGRGRRRPRRSRRWPRWPTPSTTRPAGCACCSTTSARRARRRRRPTD